MAFIRSIIFILFVSFHFIAQASAEPLVEVRVAVTPDSVPDAVRIFDLENPDLRRADVFFLDTANWELTSRGLRLRIEVQVDPLHPERPAPIALVTVAVTHLDPLSRAYFRLRRSVSNLLFRGPEVTGSETSLDKLDTSFSLSWTIPRGEFQATRFGQRELADLFTPLQTELIKFYLGADFGGLSDTFAGFTEEIVIHGPTEVTQRKLALAYPNLHGLGLSGLIVQHWEGIAAAGVKTNVEFALVVGQSQAQQTRTQLIEWLRIAKLSADFQKSGFFAAVLRSCANHL